MLSEVADLTLTSSWKDIKKSVKDDPRCSKFSSSDRVNIDFHVFITLQILVSCDDLVSIVFFTFLLLLLFAMV